jgi:hypothetical protein
MSWSVFLKAHWKSLATTDFFAVEVWSWSGLVTYYVLFVMELATRRVCIAGITKHPDTQWMLQMARQLTDGVDGILLDKRYIILDRDTKYCQAFRDFLKREGIAVIRLPPRSSESECPCRKMGARGPRRMPIEVDSDRAGNAAPCAARIRCAFSSRAQSPRPRQCTDHPGHFLPATRSTGCSSCWTWRIAQLL